MSSHWGLDLPWVGGAWITSPRHFLWVPPVSIHLALPGSESTSAPLRVLPCGCAHLLAKLGARREASGWVCITQDGVAPLCFWAPRSVSSRGWSGRSPWPGGRGLCNQFLSYPRRTQLSLLPLWSSPCSLSSGDRPQRSAWGPSVSCLGPGVTASRALSGDVAGRQQLQGSGGKRHSPGSSHMEPTLELTWFWAKLEKVGENAEWWATHLERSG